jgi:hypothetical protein
MKLKTCINLYEVLNANIFANVLYRPKFWATRARYEYASYEAWQDIHGGPNLQGVIYCNLKHLNGNNLLEIIYHEMIHQYVEEFLEVEEEDHHGEIFRRNHDLFKPSSIGVYEHE